MKKAIGILTGIMCFIAIIFTFSMKPYYPFAIESIIFGFLTFKLLKPKKKQSEENFNFPTETLQDMKKYYPKQNIPSLIQQINESLNIIENTCNIDTLLSRKEFLLKSCITLKQLEECKLYKKKPNSDYYMQKLQDDKFIVHIQRCYWDCLYKAGMLKTTKGMENRINKFWETMNKYLDEYTINDIKELLKN